MKNVFLLSLALWLGTAEMASAQLEGKRFISGSAGINFSNSNPELASASNDYGYHFNLSLGKFKTDTRVSGWRLSNALGGTKAQYLTLENGEPITHDKSGIKSVGVGIGRFWQFYKHFNEKIGVFAGPDVNLGYSNAKDYTIVNNAQSLVETTTDQVQIALGLSAGVYYRLSEKWWITGSLAFSNPFSVSYSFVKNESIDRSYDGKNKVLGYGFSPSFTFPSVGFGLRYFYKR